MNILVTGGSGFIGGTIARRLGRDENYGIVATGRSNCPANLGNHNIDYVKLNLEDPLPELDYDVCIHCAGLADDRSSNESLIASNITATENLLKHLKDCKIFIFISSASVYDFKKYPLAKEENADLQEDLSAYGRSKLLAEKVVQNSAIESIYIIRPRAVYGKFDRILLPRIQNRFKNGKITVPGDLQVKSSLTNVENIIDVVQHMLVEKKKGTSIYNVADNEQYTLRDVFTKIGSLKNRKVRIKQLPVSAVRALVRVCNYLKIPISFSQQSIDYITIESSLDTSKVRENFNVHLSHNFDGFIKFKD